MLLKSNKVMREDLGDDPDLASFLEENDRIIVRTKDEILRILNAFLQAGVDLDKENVLSKMINRHLYMPSDIDEPKNKPLE